MSTSIRTCEHNKNSHPGQIIQEYSIKRRTPAEMQADAARKAAENQRELDKLACAAAIVNKQASQDKERAASSAKKRVHMGKITDNESVDPDYRPNHSDGESEVDCEDDDDDNEMEEEENREDAPPPSKKGRRKGVSWEDIEAAHAQAASATTATLASKRKGNSTTPHVTKKPKTITMAQLLPGWKTATAPPPPLPPQAPADDDSMVQPGGFIEDDEEDIETARKSTTTRALVKVTMHTTSHLTKTARRGGAKKWKLQHLPSSASQDDFTHVLILLAKCKAGASPDPWSSLSLDEIQALVDEVFSKAAGDGDFEVSYQLSNWCNGFFSSAKEAIELFVREMLEDDPETDVASIITDYMTPRGNPPTTPYMWREWIIDPVSLQVTKRGRFQNRLVVYTLAQAHFADYDKIPDPRELAQSKLPCGALILAIQAVEHTLKLWTTGEFIDNKKSSGFFLADNYADTTRQVVGPDGRARTVTVPVASHFKSTIDSLNVAKHWVPIFDDIRFTLTSILEKCRCKARSVSVSSAASSDVDMDVPDYQLESDKDDKEQD
ncbi:hypothetical protein BJ165DRAFT_1531933 [Panaeolus papilionaceus]|nr:hypothetical protein BJ165DRAFT_1531933 [Panaeolus papilionaceus]